MQRLLPAPSAVKIFLFGFQASCCTRFSKCQQILAVQKPNNLSRTNTSRTKMVLMMIEVQMVFSWRHALIPAVESVVNLAETRWKRWDTEMCRGGAHVEDYARGILRHFKPSFYKAGFGMVPWYRGVFSKKNYFNQTLQDIFLGNRCSIRLLQNIFYLSSLGLQEATGQVLYLAETMSIDGRFCTPHSFNPKW